MSSGNNTNEHAPAEEKGKTIGHYNIGKTIGEGTFGKVKLGTHLLTGEKVAIKILEKDKITDVNDVERVAREIHILKLIRHPNIIQLYEIIETPKQLYLIMEYASGGELFEYIVSNNRVKEKEACKFFRQIIAGIEYIHKLGVVHRDLKPENLLLDHNKDIKIVDFGLSNTYKTGELLKTACGSPCYAAPEMIAGKKYMGLQVDIWSCGVILFALLCGYLPFEDANTANLYKKILSGEFTIPKFVSSEAKDLLKCILNTDPNKRYTMSDIRNHSWYNIAKNEKEPEGIIIGVNNVPIDNTILKDLESYSFNPEQAKKCIEANKHNHITTTYYLLLQKYIKSGGVSIADLSTLSFPKSPIASTRESISKKKDLTISSTIETSPTFNGKTNPTSPTIHSEIAVSKISGKATVNVNVNVNVNLNNLNTSLTKELDRSILSAVNSTRHKNEPQVKLEAKQLPTRMDDAEEVITLEPQLSPIVKPAERSSHKKQRSIIEPTDVSQKPATDSQPKTTKAVVKNRKNSDVGVAPSTGFTTPRQNTIIEKSVNSVNKSANLQSKDSVRMERPSDGAILITESDIIYETLNSSRQADVTTSTRNSENQLRDRTSQSPKPLNTTSGPKSIYSAYRSVNNKNDLKSKQKAPDAGDSRTECRTETSVEKPLRDNFVTSSLQKKLVISPRGIANETNIYSNVAKTTKAVSNSVAFTPGSLRGDAPGASFVDKLVSQNTIKTHRGPFHLNSVTTKSPKFIMSELTKAVESNKIYNRNITKYGLKCEKENIKFEVEVNSIIDQENLYLIKFNKLQGDTAKYNEICALIYQSIDM